MNVDEIIAVDNAPPWFAPEQWHCVLEPADPQGVPHVLPLTSYTLQNDVAHCVWDLMPARDEVLAGIGTYRLLDASTIDNLIYHAGTFPMKAGMLFRVERFVERKEIDATQ